MATIAVTTRTTGASTLITQTALTGTDTLGAKSGLLFINNTDASQVTINIDGDGASAAHICEGVGEVDLTGGYDIVVESGDIEFIRLGDISGYLDGTVSVTGGNASVFAWIVA